MSLLSPDKVTLYISPNKVQGVRTSGLRGGILSAFQADVARQTTDNWLDLTKACTALCKALKPHSLHVVLSDSMVRHACFPWRAELRSAQEDLAFAQLSFDDVFGTNASHDWHLAFSLASPGKSRLMVGVPKSLFEVLRGNFSDTLPAVKSITTGFTHAMTTHMKSVPSEGWLVHVEEKTATFGSWTDKGWTWINTVRASVESTDDLAALLRQELTISGARISPTQLIPVAVHAPLLTLRLPDNLAGVRLIALKTARARFTHLEVSA